MAIVRSADPAALTVGEVRDQARTARRRYLRRWLPIGIGLLMAAAMVVMAAAAPLIAPLSPSAQFSDAVLKGPGVVERHLLGTDEFGRDILSRIIWGARVSLQIGLASVLWSFVLGVPLGIHAVVAYAVPAFADRRRGLVIHAGITAVVWLYLVFVWAMSTPGGYFWPAWVILGWGLGLAIHGAVTYARLGSASSS